VRIGRGGGVRVVVHVRRVLGVVRIGPFCLIGVVVLIGEVAERVGVVCL
jgi:hypothetical protein